MQIAKFQIGPADTCETIIIDHTGEALFTVTSFETLEGDASLPVEAKFANVQLAFDHARRLMEMPIAGVLDVLAQ